MSKNIEGLWIITDIYADGKHGKMRTATTRRGRDSAIRAARRCPIVDHVEVECYRVEYVNFYAEETK